MGWVVMFLLCALFSCLSILWALFSCLNIFSWRRASCSLLRISFLYRKSSSWRWILASLWSAASNRALDTYGSRWWFVTWRYAFKTVGSIRGEWESGTSHEGLVVIFCVGGVGIGGFASVWFAWLGAPFNSLVFETWFGYSMVLLSGSWFFGCVWFWVGSMGVGWCWAVE